MAELTESVRQKGVLQPVIVRQDEQGQFWLVAGERRFRAAKSAELSTIPAMITKGNPAEIALIENIQREDLKPIEEAEAYDRMIKEYNYTQEKLSQVIGKARSTITEILSLNRLTDEIKTECRRADISKRVLIEIAKQKNPEDMASLFDRVKNNNLTGDQVRESTRQPRRDPDSPANIAIKKTESLYNSLSRLTRNVAPDEEMAILSEKLDLLKQIITDFQARL
jgi:ParB family chromosome partitioning protein